MAPAPQPFDSVERAIVAGLPDTVYTALQPELDAIVDLLKHKKVLFVSQLFQCSRNDMETWLGEAEPRIGAHTIAIVEEALQHKFTHSVVPPSRRSAFRRSHPPSRRPACRSTSQIPQHHRILMWRSQYGCAAIDPDRPDPGAPSPVSELSLGSTMGSARSTPSPSTASLRSRSPSPMLKTQTNGAGWGHCKPPRFEQFPVLA